MKVRFLLPLHLLFEEMDYEKMSTILKHGLGSNVRPLLLLYHDDLSLDLVRFAGSMNL